MRLVGEQQPDLAIVDIRMPPAHRTEGLEAAQAIREDFPETALLILSAHVEVEHAMTLLASGRRTGYLLKSRVTDVAEFLAAVARVSRGGRALAPPPGGEPRGAGGAAAPPAWRPLREGR